MSPVQQMAEEISSKKYYETVFAQILENNKAHSFPMKDNFFSLTRPFTSHQNLTCVHEEADSFGNMGVYRNATSPSLLLPESANA